MRRIPLLKIKAFICIESISEPFTSDEVAAAIKEDRVKVSAFIHRMVNHRVLDSNRTIYRSPAPLRRAPNRNERTLWKQLNRAAMEAETEGLLS